MRECPKCKYTSGNDWSQCEGGCPVVGSPYYEESAEACFGPLREVPDED